MSFITIVVGSDSVNFNSVRASINLKIGVCFSVFLIFDLWDYQNLKNLESWNELECGKKRLEIYVSSNYSIKCKL